MDIITLIVEIVLLLLISALAWAVWWKIVDMGWEHVERVLGKKSSRMDFNGCIFCGNNCNRYRYG